MPICAWSPVIIIAAAFIAIAHLGGGAQWTLSAYALQTRNVIRNIEVEAMEPVVAE